MNQKTYSKQTFIMLALVILTMTIIILYFGALRGPKLTPANIKIDGVYLPTPQNINDFKFIDNQGKAFSKKNLLGHWTFMFFGFTNCGMVCPTTLAELNKMYQTLQSQLADSDMPHVVMMSVDPDRDSVSKMNEYVHVFNKNFIGARADIAETITLEKQLHIAAAKMEADGEGKNHYTINHTSDILIFNPKGQLQAFLAYPHNAKQMVNDYKSILKINL